jgi:hypothetical protein
MKPAHLRIATFALLVLIVCERALGRIVYADLWAEDGVVLFSQAATLGWASLLEPCAGVYFLIERLIMLGALRAMPLSWLPAAVTLSSIVVLAGVMSRIVSPVYDWLIPSSYLRVAVAAMFCLLPGLTEGTGNLCGLPWILFCWLAFVGLKDPSVPLTWIEVGLSVLVTLSIGTAILLAPLFTWRLVVSKDRISRNQWVRGLAQLAVVIVLGVWLPLLIDRGPSLPLPSVWSFASLWYDHVARLVAFTPWLGDRLTDALWRSFDASLYSAGKVIFLVFVFWWTWLRRREISAQGVSVLVLGMSGWIVLAVMARPYALAAFQLRDYSRYSFPMAFAGVLYWMVVLGPWATARGIRQAIVVVFLVLNVTMSVHRFNIVAYGQERRWQATVNVLENSIATGCPHTVDIRQYPDPWQFTYVSPRPAVDCTPFTAVLPSMPKDITWLRGRCTGNVERVEWIGEARVRATGWAYLLDPGRPADAVLVTRKRASSLVPTAAAIVAIPRTDVAALHGTSALITGWTVDFDLPPSHDPLEFWMLDAGRRVAHPSCAFTGSFEPAQR